MSILNSLDWSAVRDHYVKRCYVSDRLKSLHMSGLVSQFASLALGIEDPAGNYSSVEHSLGPKILGMNRNAEKQVYDLADKFFRLDNARSVPDAIKSAQIKYLQIGVGSEISCMVNPNVCWVANTRTIWTHLVIKHADNVGKAEEELKLYREADTTSRMAYVNWAAIHTELDVALTRVAEQGLELAQQQGVVPGPVTYLWADAIASELYAYYHGGD